MVVYVLFFFSIGIQLIYNIVVLISACSKDNQPYIYIYPLYITTGHCIHAIQYVLISYLFYTQQCIYVSLSLQSHPDKTIPSSLFFSTILTCLFFQTHHQIILCGLKNIVLTNFGKTTLNLKTTPGNTTFLKSDYFSPKIESVFLIV